MAPRMIPQGIRRRRRSPSRRKSGLVRIPTTTDKGDMATRRRRVRSRQGDHRTIVAVVTLAVVALIAGVAGVTVSRALSAVAHDLPKLDIAAHKPLTRNTYIYDGAKRPHLLAVLRGDESRVVVGSAQIAAVLKQAVVAIEDRRFYQHQGVDYEAIGRALFTDLTTGHTVQGGSTITQQFIKNTYIPEEQRTEQSFSRKVREAVLAYQLEKRWSKDQILTNYLNTIYFGQGAYGIEMAARTYFGTSARRLTLPQAALLAGVIKDPSQDDPFIDAAAARERRRIVLGRDGRPGGGDGGGCRGSGARAAAAASSRPAEEPPRTVLRRVRHPAARAPVRRGHGVRGRPACLHDARPAHAARGQQSGLFHPEQKQ